MNISTPFFFILICFAIKLNHCNSISIPDISQLLPNSLVPTSPEVLAQQAGYKTEVYNVPTEKGYVINLVRIINDKIKSNRTKRVVLFVHGVFENTNSFLLMGSKGRPNDWSNIDLKNSTEASLQQLIGSDIASKSLPLLMSNFDWDVFMMSRRNTAQSKAVSSPTAGNSGPTSMSSNVTEGSLGSQWSSVLSTLNVPPTTQNQLNDYINELTTALTPDKNYYNFSYDEQAAVDLRVIIDFILEKTRQTKLDYVGHSSGSIIAILMLSRFPEMAEKFNHVGILAPLINLHNIYYNNMENVLIRLLNSNEISLTASNGEIDPVALLPGLILLQTPICLQDRLAGVPCSNPLDETFGLGSNQQDPIYSTAAVLSWACVGSFHELTQLIQSSQKNQIYYFDYRNPIKNLRAYGSLNVPKYDLAKVAVKSMSIWAGVSDRLINKYDRESFLSSLKNPYDFHLIGDESEGIYFNHLGFYFQKEIIKQFNIPFLLRIGQVTDDQ